MEELPENWWEDVVKESKKAVEEMSDEELAFYKSLRLDAVHITAVPYM